jgi:predicted amidophosphoribosyltransferase
MLLTTSYFVLIVPHWFAKICERIRYKRTSFDAGGNYFDGKKYCRRCEVYMYHDGLFCPCCGMQLRLTPSSRECKEILRKRKASRIETIA